MWCGSLSVHCGHPAAVPLQDQLTENFIAFTRNRRRLSVHVARLISRGILRNAIYFGVLGLLTTFAAAYLAPTLQPGLINPHEYGLTADGVIRQQIEQNPLGFSIVWGPVSYGLLSTAWMVVGAAMFSLAAAAAALTVKRRVLALLAPLAFYILESVVAQVVAAPQWSLLLELPTPSNQQSFPLFAAATPIVAVGVASTVMILVALRRSRSSGQFS